MKTEIIKKLMDVVAVLEKLRRRDCAYYVEEIMENVAQSMGNAADEVRKDAVTETEIREMMGGLALTMSEISDDLDGSGMNMDARILDCVRNRLLADLEA